MFWHYLCSGTRKSLKLAYSSYHILCSSRLFRRWGLGQELPFTKWPLGTVCPIQGSWSWYSKAAKALFSFLFASYWFNQLDFRSPNDRWSQECRISGSGPAETTYCILRSRPDIFCAGHGLVICKQHADVFYPSIPQVRKNALGINSVSLFQAGFYSWISDTMYWYKKHFYSDHILLSLC